MPGKNGSVRGQEQFPGRNESGSRKEQLPGRKGSRRGGIVSRQERECKRKGTVAWQEREWKRKRTFGRKGSGRGTRNSCQAEAGVERGKEQFPGRTGSGSRKGAEEEINSWQTVKGTEEEEELPSRNENGRSLGNVGRGR